MTAPDLSVEISRLPFPFLLGLVGSSLVSVFPFIMLSIKKWFEDVERYAILFPYIWITSLIILIISFFWDSYTIVPEQDKGWFGVLIVFGVTMFFSLALYSGFFLLFCVLEIISQHFRKFLLAWMIAFATITLSTWMTQVIKNEESRYNLTLSLWEWGKGEEEGLKSTPTPVEGIGSCSSNDFYEYGYCKTLAEY